MSFFKAKIKDLADKRKQLADRAGKIIEDAFVEKRSLTSNERSTISGLNQRIGRMGTEIEGLEDDPRTAGMENFGTERLERRTDEPKSTAHVALDCWLRGGLNAVGSELRAEYESRMTGFDETQKRFISTTGAIATIPTEVDDEIVVALKDYSGILSIARVDRTDNGVPKKYVSANDLSTDGELRAEGDTIQGDAASSESDPDFSGSKTLGAYSIDSGIMKLSREELLDSQVDVEQMVLTFVTQRIGRKIATLLGNGTGSAQPMGIKNSATIGPTTAVGHPTDFGYSDLVKLLHSVDPLYRKSPSCGWAMNDQSVQQLRLLVDGAQRPLIAATTQGIDEAQSLRLLGYPLVSDNSLPVLAASSKSLYFGDWNRFVIRLAGGLVIQRLDQRYADRGLIGFVGHSRVDSALLDTRAIHYLLQAAS